MLIASALERLLEHVQLLVELGVLLRSPPILRTACSTVVWSRPPNSSPISGRLFCVISLARYIAIWRGRAIEAGRFFAVHVGDLDLVEVGHRLLDVLDADLAVLDRQQVLQRLARELRC